LTSAYPVILSPEARVDLLQLYEYIVDRAGEQVALNYIHRLEGFCQGLETFPERGSIRDDIRPGLRIIGFERRVTVAFHIQSDTVMVDQVLYGGREF
jgi:toxin ParE1/3/4